MSYDYEFLSLLRKYTILDPISYMKVRKERKLAEDTTYIINKKEHCHLGVDYTKANELETFLRYRSWVRSVFPMWREFGNGESLEEYATEVLYDTDRYRTAKLAKRKK